MSRKRRPLCVDCGGSELQHTQDAEDGCWCRNCLLEPPDEKCKSFIPEESEQRRPVGANVTRSPVRGRDTTYMADRDTFPKSGTLRMHVYRSILQADGLTCDEVEHALTKSHQTVSAAVNTLMNDGWIIDSGERRRTRWGSLAIVWKVAGEVKRA